MGFLRRLTGREERDAMDLWTEQVPVPPAPPAVPEQGDLVLVDAGPKKIEVIKIVRQGTGLGLREAKDLVDGVPSVVNGASREALERAGAVVSYHFSPAPLLEPVSAGSVYLVHPGRNKIGIIKIVREATGLGLKEAKDLVESAPVPISGGDPAELRRRLTEAGAQVG
jgi:ribosomal protein L7/L12